MAYIADNTFRLPRPSYQVISMFALIGFFVGLTVLDTTHKAGLYTLILLTSMPHAAFQAIIYPWRSQTVKGSTYAAVAFAVQNSVGQLASVFAAQVSEFCLFHMMSSELINWTYGVDFPLAIRSEVYCSFHRLRDISCP